VSTTKDINYKILLWLNNTGTSIRLWTELSLHTSPLGLSLGGRRQSNNQTQNWSMSTIAWIKDRTVLRQRRLQGYLSFFPLRWWSISTGVHSLPVLVKPWYYTGSIWKYTWPIEHIFNYEYSQGKIGTRLLLSHCTFKLGMI